MAALEGFFQVAVLTLAGRCRFCAFSVLTPPWPDTAELMAYSPQRTVIRIFKMVPGSNIKAPQRLFWGHPG